MSSVISRVKCEEPFNSAVAFLRLSNDGSTDYLNNVIMLCAQVKHEEQSGGELNCFKKKSLFSLHVCWTLKAVRMTFIFLLL